MMEYDIIDFEKEVVQRSREIPVVVDFWAEWCAPCRMLTPVLERVAQQSHGKWTLAKVNTEEHPDVAATHGIQSIPNVKMFFEGRVVAEFVGALPEYAVRQWLKNNLPSRHGAKVELSGRLISDGKLADAQQILESIVADEPENEQARVLLAKTYLFSDPKKAAQLIEGLEDPRYAELIESLKTLVRLMELQEQREVLPDGPAKVQYLNAVEQTRSGNFEKALGHFIDVIRADRYYDDDGSRKACIAIFKFLGEEHPLTQKYRREFSRALY